MEEFEVEFITSAEAAELLGVDRSTLSRWTDGKFRDRLTFMRLRNDSKLYSRRSVEALAAELAGERST